MANSNYRFVSAPNQDNTGRVATFNTQVPAYATALHIVTTCSNTGVYVAELTGVMSVTADVNQPEIGDVLRISFVSDSSSRTVTFSTGFLVTATTEVIAGTKTAVIEFFFNGTAWQETNRAVTI